MAQHGDPRPATALSQRVAGHLGGPDGAPPASIEPFVETMLRPGTPHHLTHYNRGVCEFTLDVLADTALYDGHSASADRRSSYEEAARHLGFLMTGLDESLREADTGRLIRVALHAERGALLCSSVVPRRHVIGIVFGSAADVPLSRQPLVREADRAVSTLATGLRARIGLSTQNPGGWLTDKRGEEAASSTDPSAMTGTFHHRGTADPEWVAQLRRTLSCNDLVYITHWREDGDVVSVDLLGDPAVAEFWSAAMRPEAIRDFYDRTTDGFGSLARQLTQLSRQAVRGRLLRIVLDVELGAIYYYRLAAGEYLVGVNLNQSRVSQADDRMAELAARHRR